MKKINIIINSDDFGLSKSINRGIIDSYNLGLISSTTIMMNMPDVEDAIFLYKNIKDNKLGLGVHLNITVGKPLATNVDSLTDDNGKFHSPLSIKSGKVTLKYEDVYKELKTQIEKLLSYKIELDHIDCHHFMEENEIVFQAMTTLASEYNVGLRVLDSCREKFNTTENFSTDVFCDKFHQSTATYKTILNYVDENQDKESIEIMTHLGYIDEDTKTKTSYISREDEIEELKKLKQTGFYAKVNLINYKQLQQLIKQS